MKAWLREFHKMGEKELVTFSHFVPRVELNPEKRYLYYPNLVKATGSDFLRARLERLLEGVAHAGVVRGRPPRAAAPGALERLCDCLYGATALTFGGGIGGSGGQHQQRPPQNVRCDGGGGHAVEPGDGRAQLGGAGALAPDGRSRAGGSCSEGGSACVAHISAVSTRNWTEFVV